MGLTIHYRYNKPQDLTWAQTTKKLLELKEYALSLPSIGLICHKKASEAVTKEYLKHYKDKNYLVKDYDETLSSIICHSVRYVPKHNAAENDYSSMRQAPKRIFFMSFEIGEGCESLEIGLAQYARINSTSPRGDVFKAPASMEWRGFCKTQYANNPSYGGIKNFIRCHLSVCAILEKLIQLGFDVEVSDEGLFWDNHDIEALMKEVQSWDSMIAANFGALKDSHPNLIVESPITERQDFEQLEHKGQVVLESMNFLDALNLIAKMMKEEKL